LNTFLALCLYNFIVLVIQSYSAKDLSVRYNLLACSNPLSPSFLPKSLQFFKIADITASFLINSANGSFSEFSIDNPFAISLTATSSGKIIATA
jgi:hypothetical protein